MNLSEISSLTIAAIREMLHQHGSANEALLSALEADSRTGVQNLAQKERRRRRSETAEKARLEKMMIIERRLRSQGLLHIAGVDEAGRGPLAGPVVAAAVIFPADLLIPGLNDSKTLSADRRNILFDLIQEGALSFGIGQASAQEIDHLNILQATFLAMRRALEQLEVKPDRVLVDGNGVPGSPYPEIAVVDGDASSLSIAAASILAKVTRDRQMVAFDKEYPAYGFSGHKGYGSADHLSSLREHGPCPIHRRSFRGVPVPPEDFQVFADGIDSAQDMSELEAMGRSIAAAAEALPRDEVEELRTCYRRRQSGFENTGQQGERLAADALVRGGYQILARNFRAAGGEIDLIASRAGTLAFVEVKTSTTVGFGPPETRVTLEKQRQIATVARAYLQRNPTPDLAPRFDVIAIHLGQRPPDIQHLEAAFQIG